MKGLYSCGVLQWVRQQSRACTPVGCPRGSVSSQGPVLLLRFAREQRQQLKTCTRVWFSREERHQSRASTLVGFSREQCQQSRACTPVGFSSGQHHQSRACTLLGFSRVQREQSRASTGQHQQPRITALAKFFKAQHQRSEKRIRSRPTCDIINVISNLLIIFLMVSLSNLVWC